MSKAVIANSPAEPQPLLTMQDISFRYPSESNKREVICNFDLTLKQGDMVRVSGRNGSGKTTLLRLIAGQLVPTSGQIRRHKGDLRAVYLNQHASDFVAPALTVREQLVVAMGSRLSPLSSELGRDVTEEIHSSMASYDVGLADRFDRFTSELSGGQRQIVALLAAILTHADILLLDEYTSFMDKQSQAQSRLVVEDLCKRSKTAILAVDHRGTFEDHFLDTISLPRD